MESSSTTTSCPISTRRLARSMASSATVVWASAGLSKVEWITSPLTVRCMSVTSSGRSSTRTTMRWHSGLFLVIALAIACRIIVLPALGGETISPRWPFPMGLIRSMIRVVRMPWALASAGLADSSLDHVALAQPVLAHLGQRHVHVVGPGQVAGGADERVVVEHVDDARDRDQNVVLGDHR